MGMKSERSLHNYTVHARVKNALQDLCFKIVNLGVN